MKEKSPMKNTSLKIVSILLILMFAILAFASCGGQATPKTAKEVLELAFGQSFSSEEVTKGSVQVIVNDVPVSDSITGSFDAKGYFNSEKGAAALNGTALFDNGTETLTVDASMFMDQNKGIAVKSEALLGSTTIGISATDNEDAINTLASMFNISEEELDVFSQMLSSATSSSAVNIDTVQKISATVISAVVNALNKNDALTMTEASGKIAISASYNAEASADIISDVIAELETSKDIDGFIKQIYTSVSAAESIGVTYDEFKGALWSQLKEFAPMLKDVGIKAVSVKFVVNARDYVIEDFEIGITGNEEGQSIEIDYSNKNNKMSLAMSSGDITIAELTSEYKEEGGKNKFDMSVKTYGQELASISWVQEQSTGKFTFDINGATGYTGFSATLEGILKTDANTLDLTVNKLSYRMDSLGDVDEGTIEFDVRVIIRTNEDVPAFPSFTSIEDITTEMIANIGENIENLSTFFGYGFDSGK